MSELTATQCPCSGGGRSSSGCSSIIWIIILLSICGGNGDSGCGFGLGNFGNGCGGDNNCCELIILLLVLSSCCGNGCGF